MILDQNGKELAPCIISKIRDAFGLSDKHRGNKKHCSHKYWDNSAEVIGIRAGMSQKEINKVKNLYVHYII